MDTIHSIKLYCLICLTLVKYNVNLYENSYHQTTTQSMVVHYCSILDPHHTRVHSPTLPRPVPVSLLPPCNQDKKKDTHGRVPAAKWKWDPSDIFGERRDPIGSPNRVGITSPRTLSCRVVFPASYHRLNLSTLYKYLQPHDP